MNKPATKEPSMDEILSSIRQIIADDDAAAAPRRPASLSATLASQPAATEAAPEPGDDFDTMMNFSPHGDSHPLELTAEQIVPAEPEAEPEPSALDFASFVEEVTEPSVTDDAELVAAFVDPEDLSFEPEDEEVVLAAPPPPPEPVRMPPPIQARPAPPPQPVPERPVAVMVPERPAPRERPTAAQASPMPDPTLSRDIAEELLEPATNAAVRANLSKLSKLGIGNPGLTIEAMMRDMLRPMLKEWLDENLPTVVERMVEKEIARISRGVE